MKTTLLLLSILLIISLAVSGYSLYKVQEQTQTINSLVEFKIYSTNQLGSISTDIEDLKSDMKIQKVKTNLLVSDVKAIRDWAGDVVKWSRQF